MKALTAAWAALLALTVIGPNASAAGLILMIGWVKFVVIVRWFMGTRHAHPVWTAIPAGLAALVFGLCRVLLF